MRRLEIRPHIPGHHHFQRRIAPLVTQGRAPQHDRRLHTLRRQRRNRLGLQLRQHRIQVAPAQAPLPQLHQVRQPDPVGAQDAGQRMDHHRPDPQRVRHQAGMLPARAAETLQHIAGDIMPPRDRDLLDRIGHIVDGDADEALGNLARRLPHQSRDLSAPRQ